MMEFLECRVVDIDEKGRGIAAWKEKKLRIPGAVPGDVALFQTKKRLRAPQAVLKGDYAIAPRCAHVDVCGGCSWQHVPYHAQLAHKETIVRRALGDALLCDVPIFPILPADPVYFYRNKMEFTFSDMAWIDAKDIESRRVVDDRRALGLHVRKRFDRIVDLQECHLQASDDIRNELRAYALREDISFYSSVKGEGLLRNVVIRSNVDGHYMVVLILAARDHALAERICGHLCERFSCITSFYLIVNSALNDAYGNCPAELLHGEPYLRERCGHITLRIYPKSFYQTNSYQAPRLYAVVRDWLCESAPKLVYDLYCGGGSIGLYVLEKGMRLIGIESLGEAVSAAKENAADAGVSQAEFFEGKVESILDTDFISTHGFPDAVIVDPPRAGLHPRLLELLEAIRPQTICYVSCNPVSLARDLRVLATCYRIRRVHPVDMFPHTPHVETVTELQRTASR